MEIKCFLSINVYFTIRQFFGIQICHYLHINNYTWSDYQMLIFGTIWLRCSIQNICSFFRAKNNFKKISLSNVLSLMLLRSFVRNSPPAENTRSASTEVGGTTRRALWRSCSSAVCFFQQWRAQSLLQRYLEPLCSSQNFAASGNLIAASPLMILV